MRLFEGFWGLGFWVLRFRVLSLGCWVLGFIVQAFCIGAFIIIRMGFRVYYTRRIIRNHQSPILIIELRGCMST